MLRRNAVSGNHSRLNHKVTTTMAILNTKTELSNKEENTSSHSCCTINSCVEVLLDKNMQLLYVSEQYNPAEQIAVVEIDPPAVSFRPLSEMPEDTLGFAPALNSVLVKDQTPPNTRRADLVEGDVGDPPESGVSGGGCSSCAENTKKKKAGMLKRLAKGVPGLLKSELGIDQAEPQVVDKRKSICLNCPEKYYNFGVCDEELGGCGCFLASKVTIKGESCPEGHW